jgi:hypothetical protein
MLEFKASKFSLPRSQEFTSNQTNRRERSFIVVGGTVVDIRNHSIALSCIFMFILFGGVIR